MARRHRKKSRKLRGGSLFPLRPANFVLGGQQALEPPVALKESGQSGQPMQPRQSGGGSAASYVEHVAGTSQQQYNNVFSQGGPYGNVPGNTLIGQQGQGVPSGSGYPTPPQLAMAQSGGGRKRGGFLGPIVNQAAAPLALLAMQQSYRRKHRNRTSRRSRRYRKSRR